MFTLRVSNASVRNRNRQHLIKLFQRNAIASNLLIIGAVWLHGADKPNPAFASWAG
jgi:hypothetical protein